MTGLSLERTSGQLCHLLCIPRWPTFPLICSLNWKPVVSFFLYGSSLGISVSKTSDSLCIQILCWKLFYLLLTFDDSHKKVSVAQSFPTLCNPMDYSPPGFSVHGILQARILEWVAIPICSSSSQLRDRTLVSCIASRFLTSEPPVKSSRKKKDV